jgi:hypothetical protein
VHKSDFDLHFNLAFGTLNQSRFEAWFAELAGCVYGTDFELIKAGGRQGDKKSDGRRISTETVFQCYAPESPATFASRAKAKIEDSFPEVFKFWPDLKVWMFVHNNCEGVPTAISDCIEALRETYKNLTILQVSRRFLKDELHDKLTMQQMIDVYPSANLNFSVVQMDDVRVLLKKIIAEKTTGPAMTFFGDIPNEAKLDFNGLSPDAKHDIQRARPNVGIVERYLDGMSNPQNATKIQDKMREKYVELHDLGYDPDEIMGRMLTFVGGEENPKVNAAAFVILSYYFDSCDIFKNVAEGALC